MEATNPYIREPNNVCCSRRYGLVHMVDMSFIEPYIAIYRDIVNAAIVFAFAAAISGDARGCE